jgi:hypothetical protein
MMISKSTDTIRIILLTALIVAVPVLFGESYVADFLSLDSDFSSAGLGGSNFYGGGATAVFCNPAMVMKADGVRYYASHEGLFGGLAIADAAGALIRTPRGDVAIGAIYVGGGGIEVTKLPDPTKPVGPDNRPYSVGEKGHHDIAIGAGYSLSVMEGLSIGASAGGIFRRLVDSDGYGGFASVGVDWVAARGLRFGAVASNASYVSWETGNSEFGAPEFLIGGAFSRDFDSGVGGMIVGEVGFLTSSSNIELSAGAEVSYRSLAAIRLGTENGGLTAGADLAIFPGIRVGAAMTTHTELPISYRFGLNVYGDGAKESVD